MSRQEPGNVSYGWFESTETENLFMVVEEWESEAAMGAHFTGDRGKTFVQALLTFIAEPPSRTATTPLAGKLSLSKITSRPGRGPVPSLSPSSTARSSGRGRPRSAAAAPRDGTGGASETGRR